MLAIGRLVALGASYRDAAQLCDIHPSQLSRYARLHPKFRALLEGAEALAVARLLDECPTPHLVAGPLWDTARATEEVLWGRERRRDFAWKRLQHKLSPVSPRPLKMGARDRIRRLAEADRG